MPVELKYGENEDVTGKVAKEILESAFVNFPVKDIPLNFVSRLFQVLFSAQQDVKFLREEYIFIMVKNAF